MDHHCPWMNNCIGIYNVKAFLLFNLYTMLTGLYVSVRAIVEIVVCFTDGLHCPSYNNAIKIGLGIAGICFMVLFVLFTSCMLVDQIKMKLENTSTIERLQQSTNKVSQQKDNYSNTTQHSSKGLCELLREFRFRWLIPVNFGQDYSAESQLNLEY